VEIDQLAEEVRRENAETRAKIDALLSALHGTPNAPGILTRVAMLEATAARLGKFAWMVITAAVTATGSAVVAVATLLFRPLNP